MRRFKRDSPQDLSRIYVPNKCTTERFVSRPNLLYLHLLTNSPKISSCTLDTTLLELNTHEIISEPVAFEWLFRELCGISHKLSQYLVDTIVAISLLGIA